MTLELKLQRMKNTDRSTQGDLSIDDKHECFTLEDCKRDVKIYGKTCIPAGRYKVVLDYSEKHKKDDWPHILDVPGFDGVRIDIANTAEEVDGCIAVGLNRAPDWVGLSAIAWNRLVAKFKQAEVNKEEIWIEIINVAERLPEIVGVVA